MNSDLEHFWFALAVHKPTERALILRCGKTRAKALRHKADHVRKGWRVRAFDVFSTPQVLFKQIEDWLEECGLSAFEACVVRQDIIKKLAEKMN